MSEMRLVTVTTVVTIDVCKLFVIDAATPTLEWTVFAAHLRHFHLDLKLCYFLHSSFELRTFSTGQIESVACTLCSLYRYFLVFLHSVCRGESVILYIQARTEMLNLQVCPPCEMNGSFIKSC